MAKVNEVSIWENEIYQIERGDKVAGGPGGAANLAASQLAKEGANKSPNAKKRLCK